jgi:hypothetical protein
MLAEGDCLMEVYWRFKGTCCFRHYRPNGEGSKNLWNDGKLRQNTQGCISKTVVFILVAVRTWDFAEILTDSVRGWLSCGINHMVCFRVEWSRLNKVFEALRILVSRTLCGQLEIRVILFNKEKNKSGRQTFLLDTVHRNLNCVTNIALRDDWNTARTEVWYLNPPHRPYIPTAVWDSCMARNAIAVVRERVKFFPTPTPMSMQAAVRTETSKCVIICAQHTNLIHVSELSA